MEADEQAVAIRCRDGVELAGRLFLPAAVPAVAIILHGATGVPRDYYAKFARWLADARGALVLIYDYRDLGHSARGPVRRARASMADWGLLDQAAALDHLTATHPDLPVEVIGHSLGGLFLAFHEQAGRIRQITTVGSGPAYWLRHPPGYMPSVLAFWFLLGPLATALMGYLPGRALGLGSDLPARAYWQWRRWCTTPGFHRIDWGGILPTPQPDRVRGRLRLVAVADDVMMPPAVVRDLAGFYPHAPVEHVSIRPADAGQPSIGHLRIFSERCRAAWPKLAGLAPA